MKIVITNGWHDDNKGDCGIVLSIMEAFDKFRNTSFTIVSEFGENDFRFQNGYRYILEKYPEAKIIGSPWPIPPVGKLFFKNRLLRKLVRRVTRKSVESTHLLQVNSCLNILKEYSTSNNAIINKHNGNCKDLINVLNEADLIISKGGSFIFSDNTVKGAARLARVLFPLYIAAYLNKKIIFFPQSFFTLDDSLSKSIISPILKRATVFTREQISSQYLRESLKIENSYFPDIACFLSSKAMTDPILSLLDNLISGGSMLIGLTVRDWQFSKGKACYIKSIKSIIEAVLAKYSNGHIIIVPQVTGPVSFENDLIIMNDIYRNVSRHFQKRVIAVKKDCTPYMLKNIYSRFQTILGTRLHSLIYSFSVGVPGIALSYSPNKTIGFFKQFDLENLVFDINNIPIDNCVEAIGYVIEHRSSIMEKYQNTVEKYRSFLPDVINSIINSDTKNNNSIVPKEIDWIDLICKDGISVFRE